AAGTNGFVPTGGNLILQIADKLGRFVCLEQEARMLGENILGICVATHIATLHRKVPALLRDRWCWRQVISGRQFPIFVLCNQGMIARMIVGVRDKGIETDPEE